MWLCSCRAHETRKRLHTWDLFEDNQKRLHTWASLVKKKIGKSENEKSNEKNIFLSCDSAAVALTKHERGYILGICLKTTKRGYILGLRWWKKKLENRKMKNQTKKIFFCHVTLQLSRSRNTKEATYLGFVWRQPKEATYLGFVGEKKNWKIGKWKIKRKKYFFVMWLCSCRANETRKRLHTWDLFEDNQKRLHTWASLVKKKIGKSENEKSNEKNIFLSCDFAAVALTKHERGYILGICLKTTKRGYILGLRWWKKKLENRKMKNQTKKIFFCHVTLQLSR